MIFIGKIIALLSLHFLQLVYKRFHRPWRLALCTLFCWSAHVICWLLVETGFLFLAATLTQLTKRFVSLLLNALIVNLLITKGSRKRYHATFTSNPAFGGRGQGICLTFRKNGRTFDSTLGFPGEGWNPLRLATWNTHSLTYERFQYCRSLNYDVLPITEL